MSRPSRELKQAESAIHTVIESLIESQEALVEIGEKLEDRALKRYFLTESLRRAQFRGELESVLNQEGVSDFRECGGTAATLRHGWASLRFRPQGGDPTLLATAELGEDAAREVYVNAIHAVLPQPVRQLLSSQAAHIQESHDYVKAALDRAKKHAA
ncbi:MAG: PA2169 family four-helix-bundle protein [Terracidiphilus sp.]